MVLLAAGRDAERADRRTVGVSRPTMIGLRDRHQVGGITALEDQPRSGRPAEIDFKVVVATLADDGQPPKRLGITHWPARFMAAELGISFASAARISRRWKNQRITFHFTPSSCSWLNMADLLRHHHLPGHPPGLLSLGQGTDRCHRRHHRRLQWPLQPFTWTRDTGQL